MSENFLNIILSRLVARDTKMRMDRIGRLQNTVNLMTDDATTSFFRADAVERQAARGVGAETEALTNQVNAMQKALMKLSARVDELQTKH